MLDTLCGLGDLAGAQAPRAHAHAFGRSIDHRLDGLGKSRGRLLGGLEDQLAVGVAGAATLEDLSAAQVFLGETLGRDGLALLELEGVVVLGAVGDLDLPRLIGHALATAASDLTSLRFPLGTTVEAVERELILQTLASTNNKTRAAETLGVSYKTLLTKIKDYEL